MCLSDLAGQDVYHTYSNEMERANIYDDSKIFQRFYPYKPTAAATRVYLDRSAGVIILWPVYYKDLIIKIKLQKAKTINYLPAATFTGRI